MAKGGRVVKDVDHGWQAFRRTVERLARERPRIVTGIVAEENPPHGRSKKGETVAEIAAKNEFGIGVPQRSFLRSTFDENRDAYQRYLSRGIQREVVNVAQTNRDINTESSVTLKRLALKTEGDVKRKIAAFIPPPNSPATIRAKGSSTPLIWTGQMRRAVTGQIRRAK